MNTELQKRLYAMEVEPPSVVWEKLSDHLDEINADNRIARILEESQVDPGLEAWKKIAGSLDGSYMGPDRQTARVVGIKRFAAAAIIIGLLLGAYFLFLEPRSGNNTSITSTEIPSEKTEPRSNIATPEKQDVVKKEIPVEVSPTTPRQNVYAINRNHIPAPRSQTGATSTASTVKSTHVSDHLEEKTFNQSLEDLSFVASNTGYMTMVSADGRLVKIPEKYSSIAPYLQDKSEYPDYLADILSGEGAYWKDKFREWRQQLAQSSVTPSHDNFFDIISLLKNIQEN